MVLLSVESLKIEKSVVTWWKYDQHVWTVSRKFSTSETDKKSFLVAGHFQKKSLPIKSWKGFSWIHFKLVQTGYYRFSSHEAECIAYGTYVCFCFWLLLPMLYFPVEFCLGGRVNEKCSCGKLINPTAWKHFSLPSEQAQMLHRNWAELSLKVNCPWYFWKAQPEPKTQSPRMPKAQKFWARSSFKVQNTRCQFHNNIQGLLISVLRIMPVSIRKHEKCL